VSDLFPKYIQALGARLREGDKAPGTLPEWMGRRKVLVTAIREAMGPWPEKDAPLEVKAVGTLERKGYVIEKLLLQTRPGVWMTANFYRPTEAKGKVPGVLCVHGHWANARREPVVQSRCVGLVKLGFAVLLVDAFSAGERHPTIAPKSYHGALMGASLWPAGQTLLGVQAYDNRRAADYLASRPEVDGSKLGITGASGGGNQTMYAGALDSRFAAVVPVCSVGAYQAYLRAACCVCEVLPGALSFTEEGDVLGLVAPRALMVINATKDAYQFSVGQAKTSVERARAVYKLYGKEASLAHTVIDSGHDYNQAMREAMYGWMVKHLKGEGDGKPVPEPKIETEKVEDLACFPDGKRPAGFVFAPMLAAQEAEKLLAPFADRKLDHAEAWEAKAGGMRHALRKVLGPEPAEVKPTLKFTGTKRGGGRGASTYDLAVEEGVTLPGEVKFSDDALGKMPACLLLHLDGKDAAFKHPLAEELIAAGQIVHAIDLRATGSLTPKGDGHGKAPDHNSAEHGVWCGRPLLGQWVTDVGAALAMVHRQPGVLPGRVTLIGIGQAGLIALIAGSVHGRGLQGVAVLDMPASYVTKAGYPDGTRMGLLAPGLFRAGDVPHLAALLAPTRLLVAGGRTAEGKELDGDGLKPAFAFTRKVYGLLKAGDALRVEAKPDVKAWVKG
jgi:dienelactone hydrolase